MNDSQEIFEEVDITKEPKNLAYDDETIIWKGRPSQWVNLGTFVFWTLLMLASLFFVALWTSGLSDAYSTIIDTVVVTIVWVLVVISFLNIALAYLNVRFERTVITKNKIKESRGITRLFQVDKFAELADIKDFESPAAGILAIWGLSTLLIHTHDEDQPLIQIRAIRDRDDLINKLLPIWRELKIERKGYFQ